MNSLFLLLFPCLNNTFHTSYILGQLYSILISIYKRFTYQSWKGKISLRI